MMIALQSLISIGFIVFLLFGPLNTLRVDLLRHRLFSIRSRMFEDAAEGRISFNSSGYKYTRTVINGMLRFAHRMSLSRAVTARCLMSETDSRIASECQRFAMNRSLDEDRDIAQQYLREANMAIIKHLATSPFFGLLLLPLVAWVFASLGFGLLSWVVRHTLTLQLKLDQVMFEEGALEEAPGTSIASMSY